MYPTAYLYYLLHLVPVALAVSFNAAYAYWLVSSIGIAILVVWLWRGGFWRRLAALVLNGTTTFANIALASSLYLQGTGFNAPFFHHLDGETFAIAREAFAPLFFGALIYLLVLCAWPLALRRQSDTVGRVRLAVAATLGLVCNAPLISLVGYGVERLGDERAATIIPQTLPKAIVVEPLVEPRNLVLVFAESLEATYSRAGVFGEDLTPRLSDLATQGIRFTDIRQVRDTEATITGMIAAMCALPLRTSFSWENINVLLPNVDAPLRGQSCLADVLTAHGYGTAYMGGAPLAFAGKGKFLAAHGFDERYGREALQARFPDASRSSGWGVHDDALFAFADEKLEEWSRGEEPFMLALLTLDTHHPSGLPSTSCGLRAGMNGMEFAVRCSDRLLADFIDGVRERHPTTVVVLLSDHLAHRNDLSSVLNEHAESRRLRFAVWSPDADAAVVDKPGTHFDVMPTLLDFLGFENWRRHNLGASLLRFDSPWFALGSDSLPALTQSLPPIRLQRGEQIVFEAKGPLIRVDGRKLLANVEGLALEQGEPGIFAVEFHGDGRVAGFRSNRSMEAFSRPLRESPRPDSLLVGVSANDAFNRRFVPDHPAKLTYFTGRFGTEAFAVNPLWWRETVDVSAILDAHAGAIVGSDPERTTR